MFKYEGAKNNSYIAKVATISHEDIKELLLCRKKNLKYMLQNGFHFKEI